MRLEIWPAERRFAQVVDDVGAMLFEQRHHFGWRAFRLRRDRARDDGGDAAGGGGQIEFDNLAGGIGAGPAAPC